MSQHCIPNRKWVVVYAPQHYSPSHDEQEVSDIPFFPGCPRLPTYVNQQRVSNYFTSELCQIPLWPTGSLCCILLLGKLIQWHSLLNSGWVLKHLMQPDWNWVMPNLMAKREWVMLHCFFANSLITFHPMTNSKWERLHFFITFHLMSNHVKQRVRFIFPLLNNFIDFHPVSNGPTECRWHHIFICLTASLLPCSKPVSETFSLLNSLPIVLHSWVSNRLV